LLVRARSFRKVGRATLFGVWLTVNVAPSVFDFGGFVIKMLREFARIMDVPEIMETIVHRHCVSFVREARKLIGLELLSLCLNLSC
ncbi:hypothetical protein, partial [Mycobacterium tuberculosis]